MRADEWVLQDAGLEEAPVSCHCGMCTVRNGMWWRGDSEADCLLTYLDAKRWNFCPRCGTRLDAIPGPSILSRLLEYQAGLREDECDAGLMSHGMALARLEHFDELFAPWLTDETAATGLEAGNHSRTGVKQ